MAERLVVNTGPVITMSKMGVLPLIETLPYEFITTPQVVEELKAGMHLGHPSVFPQALHVVSLRSPLHRFGEVTLGIGEASVIQLALQEGIQRV